MNREEFLHKLDDFDFDSFGKDDNYDNADVYEVVRFFAHKIYDEFEEELKQLKNENARLKKQLANNHHIECNCSFYKPNLENIENNTCKNCKTFEVYKGEYGRCNKGINNYKTSYLHNSFYCNCWELNAN